MWTSCKRWDKIKEKMEMIALDKLPCLPVKITDKQWAEKLQDGSVFMRSLYEYGSWSAVTRSQCGDEKMKSGVQGDTGEGIVRRIDPRVGDDFFNRLPDDLRSVMKSAFYIDQERYQFYKVYCMYGLTYIPSEKKFEKPDQRLSEFGNTAVIIYNPNEFLRRILLGLERQFGDNVNFRLDEVHYYPPDYYGELDEFCKEESYSWQNELRIRVALLDPTSVKIDKEGRERKRIIQNTDPITLNIGDIRDITTQIPIGDFIDLHLPDIIQPPV